MQRNNPHFVGGRSLYNNSKRGHAIKLKARPLFHKNMGGYKLH